MKVKDAGDKPERRVLNVEGFEVEARADDSENPTTIVGYAAVFDKRTDIGWFHEVVARGAFTETIANDDVRALVDHNPSKIIGRTKAGTLSLSEDDHGLRMSIDVSDTSAGRDILASVKRGDVDGASFSFDVLDDKWEKKDGKDLRTLLRTKLYDVGPVSFPAYGTTSVSARSWDAFKEENKEADETKVVEQAREEGSRATEYADRITRSHEINCGVAAKEEN